MPNLYRIMKKARDSMPWVWRYMPFDEVCWIRLSVGMGRMQSFFMTGEVFDSQDVFLIQIRKHKGFGVWFVSF